MSENTAENFIVLSLPPTLDALRRIPCLMLDAVFCFFPELQKINHNRDADLGTQDKKCPILAVVDTKLLKVPQLRA